MTEEQKLFSDFTPSTMADWEHKAQKDLRETPLESLNQHTYEGIEVKPFYAKEDIANLATINQEPGQFPFVRGREKADNSWRNIQQIQADGDGKDAIDKAADALNRGADGIHFVINEQDAFDVAYLAGTVDLSKYSISYTLKEQPAMFLKRLFAALQDKNIAPSSLYGFLNFDPISVKSAITDAESKSIIDVLDLTKDCPNFYGITVNATSFSGIGASVTQELAYTVSAAVTYIDKLTDAGESLESILGNMQFHVASGTNYFFEIAKLRALRLLWAAVVQAYQAKPEAAAQLRIHSSTSSWYQTTLDPYVNMLRATTEAMSAVIAGCDSLTVIPFNSTYKASDEFAERIARNVSIILKEEAYLDKAIDPAAGSYYLESLTHELTNKAWSLFKDVEERGGFETAYKSGFILGSITEVSRKKFRNIATGREVLVGTNKYPNPKEVIEYDPEELIQSDAFDTTRASYPTEVMRLAAELHLRKKQRRPKAVIAVIGEALQRHINATFAQEFFTCAGFDTQIQQFESVTDASDKLESTTAEVLVVSSSETAYVKEFGPRIRNHHAKPTLILADNPDHMKDEMVANGYEEFIFEDCDMSSILDVIQKKLHGGEETE